MQCSCVCVCVRERETEDKKEKVIVKDLEYGQTDERHFISLSLNVIGNRLAVLLTRFLIFGEKECVRERDDTERCNHGNAGRLRMSTKPDGSFDIL